METIRYSQEVGSIEWWNALEKDLDNVRYEVDDILLKINRNLNYEKSSQKLIRQLKNYLLESKQKWFVVWVSGWVDSALVSTLCALTWEKTIVMDLPIHQRQEEVSRASKHMDWLQKNFPNVQRYSIDLTQTFETFKKALPKVDDEIVRYMAYVNSRSRLRAVTLYAVWNEHNCIVAGTGNKVEDYGIWFFTKYWDWAVDISPIWELLKSEVYHMAKHLWVNEDILNARPTDWLHPDWATDEDQIWCSYDELEWAMYKHSEFMSIITSNFLPSDDENATKNFLEWFSGRKREVMEIYLNRHFANAHKMQMPRIFEI